MENKDFNGVFFVLAHEFGHIYLKHVTFWNIVMTFIARITPVYGQLFSRAREYSCDRIAQVLTGSNGTREMMCLSAGRHLYKHVDLDDYLANARKEKGLFLWFVNLMAYQKEVYARICGF